MTKAGDNIRKGLQEAIAYARGEKVEGIVVHTPEEIATRSQKIQRTKRKSSKPRS